MTTQAKLFTNKERLLELADLLQNVSQAWGGNRVSRQHFFDLEMAYQAGGYLGNKEKNRGAPEVGQRGDLLMPGTLAK